MFYWQIIYSFFDEDYGNVTVSCNEMGIRSVDINNIDLDDAKFYEDDPKTFIHVKHVAWCNEYKQCKAFKKKLSKELILVT